MHQLKPFRPYFLSRPDDNLTGVSTLTESCGHPIKTAGPESGAIRHAVPTIFGFREFVGVSAVFGQALCSAPGFAPSCPRWVIFDRVGLD